MSAPTEREAIAQIISEAKASFIDRVPMPLAREIADRILAERKHHDLLWLACKKLDGDYDPWGANERWADNNKSYPDCSAGCKWYYTLEDRGKQHISMDWGICANVKSHRCGLLTFEHQGCEEFES